MMSLRGLFLAHSYLAKVFSCSCRCDFNTSTTNGKVTVVRKKFTRDSVEVLEAKPAASVLKKLNWENHHLFGNVVKDGRSGKRRGKKQNSEWKDDIPDSTSSPIQYEMNFKILPEGNLSDNSGCPPHFLYDKNEVSLESEYFPVCSTNILNAISGFPLSNEAVVENKYKYEANVLRKHLQSCSSTVPSVTKVLDKTMPAHRAAALEQWKMQMIEKMGNERFEAYQKEILSTGSTFHKTVSDILSGMPKSDLIVPPSNTGHWESIQHVLPVIDDVWCLEEYVKHPFLQYAGVVDCLAHYRDQLIVVEWKTSKKPKPTLQSTYDSPLQLAAYVGALNFDSRYRLKVKNGLIVVAYEDGNPAHCHFLDKELLSEYWTEWLKRLKTYWESL